MAPKRKTISETSSSKTTTQQRRCSQRAIGLTANNGTNKSVVLTQQKKQSRSKRRQNKKYHNGEKQFDINEEDTSTENPKSMNIDSNDVDSGDQDLSTSNSCSNTSNADGQVKEPSGIQLDIDDDDDDIHEFQAMFMTNATLSKSHPNSSSTPLVQSRQDKPSAVRAAAESASSHQTKKPTHRRPLSTINVDHQPATTNLNRQNLNTPTNLRISTNSSPATQVSIRNQSLSNINYTTNNNAILETFVEYPNLRRDLQRAEQKVENWKADYEALQHQLQKLQKNSFPRPNVDGRAFLEQLLESLNSCEQDKDNRTSAEIAKAIGIPETILLSCSAVDPQKTALHVFNAVFPVWSRRCTLGCVYSMSQWKDAIGNSIRCARYKVKMGRVQFAAAAAVNQFEPAHVDDDMEIIPQEDDGF
ncbi:unnamed protein product [Rotaria sordida]|uniref:Uncharacterized protein n=1 Tax=Rotaria sordida TaxID=392033 RepID=A0A813XN16_9BILA|nr:unnamed protein product [Rotaria sordida]